MPRGGVLRNGGGGGAETGDRFSGKDGKNGPLPSSRRLVPIADDLWAWPLSYAPSVTREGRQWSGLPGPVFNRSLGRATHGGNRTFSWTPSRLLIREAVKCIFKQAHRHSWLGNRGRVGADACDTYGGSLVCHRHCIDGKGWPEASTRGLGVGT